jgi:hypothetical protein
MASGRSMALRCVFWGNGDDAIAQSVVEVRRAGLQEQSPYPNLPFTVTPA